MMDSERFERLKKTTETIRRKADQAAGALEETRRRLLEEHACASLEEARAKLEELRSKAARRRARYEELLAELETEYGDALRG
jgi:chromosome segregation ATPase